MATANTVEYRLRLDPSGVQSGAAEAAQAINGIGAAGAQAGAQASQGLNATEQASKKLGETQTQAKSAGDALLATLRDQVAISGKSTEELLRYRAAQAGVATEAGPLIQQLMAQKTAQQAAAEAARTEEVAQREAAAAKQRAQASADAFVDSLRDQATVQGKTATEVMRYRAAQLGVSEGAEQYIAALDAGNKAHGRGAISAGQHAMAMRQLPMQITDVVTSLASGMPVWMVAVQQGGQIKDSFGGAGNALKALAGLVTPATVAFGALAVGAGLLATAYYQGSQEADNYRKTILMTGGIAGVTVSQMGDMAKAIGDVTGGQHAASAALVEMAGSGKIAGDNLQGFTQVAMDLEKYVGQPVKTTAGHMAELGNEPVKASIKLNEQYHYLTDTVYLQIKALEEQGRKEEAAALAQKTYSSAMAQRAAEMKANMGSLERGWDSLASSATRAWNAMLNVGRAATLGDLRTQIEETNRELSDLLDGKQLTYAESSFGLGARGPAAKIAELQRKISDLTTKAAPLELEAVQAQVKAEEQAKNEEITAARERLNAQAKSMRSRTDLRNDEIKQLEKDRKTVVMSEEEFNKRLANINENYKDPKKPKGGGGGITVTDSDLAGMRSQLEAAKLYQQQLQQMGASATTLNAAEKKSLEIGQQLKLATDEKTIARLKEKQGIADQLAVITRSNEGLAKSYKAHQDLIDATGKDADSIIQRAKEQETANTVFGKGRTAIEEMTLATLEHQLAEADSSDSFDPAFVASLERKTAAQRRFVDSLKDADYNTVNAHTNELLRNAQELASTYSDELGLARATGLEREQIVARRQVELKYAKELAKIEAGSLKGLEKEEQLEKVRQARAIESTAAVAKATEQHMAKSADEINRSLTDALLRGFESGKDFAKNFADTVKNMFNTMVLRPIISAVMAPVSGAINGVVQGVIGSGGSGGSSIMGMASNASSIYSLASGNSTLGTVGGWLGLGGGTAAAATGGLGLSAGATGLGLTAGTAGATGLGLTAGSAGVSAIGAGLGTSAAVTGGAGAAGAGAAGAGISGALAAVPGWGWAALAVLAVLGSGAFSTRGANHSGGVYSSAGQSWNDSASLLMGNDKGNALGDFTQRGNAEMGAGVQKAVTGLIGVYDQLAGVIGTDRKIDVVAGFAANGKHKDEDSYGYYKILDKVSGEVIADYRNRELGKDEAAWQKYVTDMGAGIVKQLRGADIPKWIDDTLAALGDSPTLESIAQAVQQISAAQVAFKQFGLAMPAFSQQTDAALTSLMGLAGGRDALVTQLSGFYGNYFSEAEKTTVATQMVTDELAKLGYAMPTSRDQFKDWVNTAIASGEAGTTSAAGLLKLEGAVAGLLPAAEAAVSGISKTMEGLLSQRSSLDAELLRAQGDQVGYLAAQRDIATQGYSDAERAAWDYNEALKTQAKALDDAAAAEVSRLEQVSQKMAQYAQQQQGLAQTLASSASAALSARNSAGGLLDRINGAMGGDATAYALKREQELWATMSKASYEQQIDLAGQLTDSVLGRLEVEKQASDKLLSIHQSLRDSIEATRTGQLSPLTLGQKVKEAGDQFYAAVAKANAGDTEAAGLVTGLRSTYLELAQRYYAASDDYTSVFNATEYAITGLAGQMQTDAQQQLGASQATVAELQRLKDIAEQAYAQADRDYATNSQALNQQATHLASMDGGIGMLGDLLSGLPAELAAQLQPLLGSGMNDQALAALMRSAQNSSAGLMLGDLQQLGLGAGGTADQIARVSGQLYTDAEVAKLLQDGKKNYPGWSMDQLAALGQSQYGIGSEQLNRVINGSHANGLERVPFDGYLAQLHQGELVMPAKQSEMFRGMDFNAMGRGMEAMASELKAVRTELRQAQQQNAQLMSVLVEVTEAAGSNTAQQLRQAVREVALSGVKAR